jgi:hypothetical protein
MQAPVQPNDRKQKRKDKFHRIDLWLRWLHENHPILFDLMAAAIGTGLFFIAWAIWYAVRFLARAL